MLIILQQLNLLEDTSSVPVREADMYLHGVVDDHRDLGVVILVSTLYANWVDRGISGMQINDLVEGFTVSLASSISGSVQSTDVVKASGRSSTAVVHGRYVEDEMVGVDSLLLNAESGVKTTIIAVETTNTNIGDK